MCKTAVTLTTLSSVCPSCYTVTVFYFVVFLRPFTSVSSNRSAFLPMYRPILIRLCVVRTAAWCWFPVKKRSCTWHKSVALCISFWKYRSVCIQRRAHPSLCSLHLFSTHSLFSTVLSYHLKLHSIYRNAIRSLKLWKEVGDLLKYRIFPV